jgi:hypothetical protein
MNRAPTATAPPKGWVAPKAQKPNNTRAFIAIQMFNFVFLVDYESNGTCSRRVDKRCASTVPALKGGCAALIHPTFFAENKITLHRTILQFGTRIF